MRGHVSKLGHRCAIAVAASAALASSRQALALTFNLIPAAGTPQQAIDGFNAASQRWSSLFSDNVTVNININYSNLGGNILGQASSSSDTFAYTATRNALQADRISADDFTSYSNLQPTPGVKMLLNYTSNSPNGNGSPTPYIDNDGDPNNTTLRVNYANAKALGLRPANDPASDASISFSSAFTWDFDPKDGISGGYDFVGAATHEIGHALGFTSGVDVLDTNSSPGNFFPDDEFTFVKPLDLFRFSTDSVSTGGAGTIDWTADARAKFFSIDGGVTNLALYSTGRTHGDGQQASHWKDNLALGIMDPTAGVNEQMLISNLDRQALDVVGWNPANSWSWIDPAGGTFASPAKWSSSIVPQTAQDAVFNLNNTYTVTFNAPATNANAHVRAGVVTFALGANSYTLSGDLNVAAVPGDVATLVISAGATAAIKTGGLTIGGAGKLDLKDNKLVVDYTGPSVAPAVRGYLVSGRNGGSWDGPGIDSSAVGNGTYHALGYADASDSLGLVGTQTALWNGQTVDATAVLVKYTYGGDATLDGQINVDDYGRIDFNIGMGTGGWSDGDFNYDGKIDIDDYGIIDFNVGIQGAQLSNSMAATPSVAGLTSLSAVPEPGAAIGILVAGATALVRRRQRRASITT